MKQLVLPFLGVPVSRIGLGCGRLFGGPSRKDSAALIATARELGITYFDTAPSYGLGQAEEVLGEILGSDPACAVATKVGISRMRGGGMLNIARKLLRPLKGPMLSRAGQLAAAAGSRRNLFAPADVQRSLEDSLRLLRRDTVDVLLLHEPRPEDVGDALVACIEDLKVTGLVRIAGSSTSGGLDDLVPFGEASQHHWRYETATASAGLQLRHGVLRSAVPSLRQALKSATDLKALSVATGFDLADPATHGSYLLTVAAAASPHTMILVSSSDHLRLRRTVAGINWDMVTAPTASFLATWRNIESRIHEVI
jgi:predicted aldo/keto reductase-like oxidoreductase